MGCQAVTLLGIGAHSVEPANARTNARGEFVSRSFRQVRKILCGCEMNFPALERLRAHLGVASIHPSSRIEVRYE
jgi:hypothetical protein